jgi:hypothetical protein
MRRMSVTRRSIDDGRVCHEIQGLWLRLFEGRSVPSWIFHPKRGKK